MALNHEVIKKEFKAKIELDTQGQAVRNEVYRVVIEDQTYYAKGITSFLDTEEHGDTQLLRLEDGLTQVFTLTLMHTLLDSPQPLAFLYNEEDEYWLLTQEVPHNSMEDTLEHRFGRNYENLRTLSEFLSYMQRALFEGIDQDEEEVEKRGFSTKVEAIKALLSDIQINTEETWESLKTQDNDPLEPIFNALKGAIKKTVVTMSDSQKESFVDLLIIMRLLDEDDFSIKNIVFSDERAVFYDVDLTLSVLNNTVKRMNDRHVSRLDGKHDFTASGLIHPPNLKTKFWLDTMENYNHFKFSIFDDLFDDAFVAQRLQMLNERLEQNFAGIVEASLGNIHLDEGKRAAMQNFIEQHLSILQGCIVQRKKQMIIAERNLSTGPETEEEAEIQPEEGTDYYTQTQIIDKNIDAISKMIKLYVNLQRALDQNKIPHKPLKVMLASTTKGIKSFISEIRDAGGEFDYMSLFDKLLSLSQSNHETYKYHRNIEENPFYELTNSVFQGLMTALAQCSGLTRENNPSFQAYFKERIDKFIENNPNLNEIFGQKMGYTL